MVPPPRHTEEMVPTLKGATAHHLLLLHGRITAAELARALDCSLSAAYRTLQRLELSDRFVLVYERPYWYLRQPDEIRVERENEPLS